MTEFADEFYIADRVKPQNESIYINTDAIQAAIYRKKQIAFRYFEYRPDKSKEYKHDGYEYYLSPYALVWNEDKYYVLGYSAKHEKVVTFRVDRISEVIETDLEAVLRPEDFNAAEFCRNAFDMYDGESVAVGLRCKNELMKVIIDRFGEEVHTEVIDGDWFRAKAEVLVSPMFFGWLLQFTGRMVLESPKEVVNAYHKTLENARDSLL